MRYNIYTERSGCTCKWKGKLSRPAECSTEVRHKNSVWTEFDWLSTVESVCCSEPGNKRSGSTRDAEGLDCPKDNELLVHGDRNVYILQMLL
jgi:hypothetical protein